MHFRLSGFTERSGISDEELGAGISEIAISFFFLLFFSFLLLAAVAPPYHFYVDTKIRYLLPSS